MSIRVSYHVAPSLVWDNPRDSLIRYQKAARVYPPLAIFNSLVQRARRLEHQISTLRQRSCSYNLSFTRLLLLAGKMIYP